MESKLECFCHEGRAYVFAFYIYRKFMCTLRFWGFTVVSEEDTAFMFKVS